MDYVGVYADLKSRIRIFFCESPSEKMQNNLTMMLLVGGKKLKRLLCYPKWQQLPGHPGVARWITELKIVEPPDSQILMEVSFFNKFRESIPQHMYI